MEKSEVKRISSYKSARFVLLSICVLTTINAFMGIMGQNVLLFTALVPYMACIYAVYAVNSLFYRIILIVWCCVLPLGMYMICYIKSKEHYKWIAFASILYLLDTIIYVIMALQTGEIQYYLFYILVSVLLLVMLMLGYKDGKKLNNLQEVVSQRVSDLMKQNIVQNDNKNKGQGIVFYDESYAKQNKCSTKYYSLIMLFILFASMFILTSIISYLGETNAAFVGSVLVLVAISCSSAYYISPFTSAKNFAYQYENANTIKVIYVADGSYLQSYENIKVEKKTAKLFYCSYERRGKKRKCRIANAYPDIEELFRKVKAL